MRELKFRVWNGMEMVHDVTVGKFGTFYVNPSNNGLDEKDSASLTPFTTKYSDTIPVMQFTGLKDKNGKEIYEGDIVPRGIIVFANGKFQGNYYEDGGRLAEVWEDDLYQEKNIEVLGNIYENPDLL